MRRPALGRLRPDARAGAGRRRRGARRVLQARGRPALRRAPRGRAPRRAGRRRARRRQRDAAPGVGPRARAPAPARARRRRAAAAGRGRRHARGAARALHPAHPRGAGRRAQGDRAAQPPRVVELPDLPLVRAGVGVPVVRRHARHAPRRRPAGLPSLRPPRARARRAATPAARSRSRATARAPSAWSQSSTGDVFRLDGEVADPARVLAAFEAAPRGVLVGTQMVAKGHDFPDVDLGVVVDADATLRFPDFRAEERTFALVTQLAGPRRARGARRRAACSCRRWRPTRRRSASPPRHDADGFLAGELERRARAALPAVLDAHPRRLLVGGPGRRAGGRGAPSASAWPTRSGPAPLFRLRGRERAQVVVKAQDRARGGRPGRRRRAGGRRGPRPPRRRVQRGRRPAVATLQGDGRAGCRAGRRGRRGAGGAASRRPSIPRSPRGAMPRSRTCACSAIPC